MNIGTKIRIARLDAGISQVDLAKKARIHPPNLCRMECGINIPGLASLSRIAIALNLPLVDLLPDPGYEICRAPRK